MPRALVAVLSLTCACSGPAEPDEAADPRTPSSPAAKAEPAPPSQPDATKATGPAPAAKAPAPSEQAPPSEPSEPNPLDDCEVDMKGPKTTWSCHGFHLTVRPDDGTAAKAEAAIPDFIQEMYDGKTTTLDERTAFFTGSMRDIPELWTVELVQLDEGQRQAITGCSANVDAAAEASDPKIARCLELMPFARAELGNDEPPGRPFIPKQRRPRDFVPASLDDCLAEKLPADSTSWDCGSVQVARYPHGLYEEDEIESELRSAIPGKWKGELRWLDVGGVALYTGVEQDTDDPLYAFELFEADPSTTSRQTKCSGFVDEPANEEHPMVQLCLRLLAQVR